MGRRLGQHFLTDRSILDRIVEALEPHPEDVVVEIGPGRGTLTARLARRVGRVIAIEKDATLGEKLREEGRGKREEYSTHNLDVIVGDALEVDWPTAVGGGGSPLPSSLLPLPSFKVIGNIPYYITSPLIDKALTPPLPSRIVFLVQKEFAERLAAEPGSKTYGALTAGVQAVANVERLFPVKAGSFAPPPKVDSAVVRITPKLEPLVEPPAQPGFRSFLASLFSQRRKQLGRSLRDVTGKPKEELVQRLEGLGIHPESRPEVLSPRQLVDLFQGLNR